MREPPPVLETTHALRQVFFGYIQIDGVTRDYDVVIEGGEIRKRKKKPSKAQADQIDPAIGGKFSKAMRDEEAG